MTARGEVYRHEHIPIKPSTCAACVALFEQRHPKEEEYKYIPVVPVGAGALELASLLTHTVGLSERQGTVIALILQNHINGGLLVGKVVTGDHEENGETVLDWTDLEKTDETQVK